MVSSLHLNKHLNRLEVNEVASFYGRSSSEYEGWLRDGLLKYWDKKKALGWLRTRGLQLPKMLRSSEGLSFASIPERGDFVKSDSVKNLDTRSVIAHDDTPSKSISSIRHLSKTKMAKEREKLTFTNVVSCHHGMQKPRG